MLGRRDLDRNTRHEGLIGKRIERPSAGWEERVLVRARRIVGDAHSRRLGIAPAMGQRMSNPRWRRLLSPTVSMTHHARAMVKTLSPTADTKRPVKRRRKFGKRTRGWSFRRAFRFKGVPFAG